MSFFTFADKEKDDVVDDGDEGYYGAGDHHAVYAEDEPDHDHEDAAESDHWSAFAEHVVDELEIPNYISHIETVYIAAQILVS